MTSTLYTQAWAEAMASCPTDPLIYPTIELQHPEFKEAGAPVPLRFVLDAEDRQFGIEPGALFGGQPATFAACAFEADYPEFAEGKLPSCRIAVDNVSRHLTPYLNAAIQVRADLVLIYREYRSDDVSEPCYGPARFRVTEVVVTGSRVEGTATLRDLTNSKFPQGTYTRALFPGLIQS